MGAMWAFGRVDWEFKCIPDMTPFPDERDLNSNESVSARAAVLTSPPQSSHSPLNSDNVANPVTCADFVLVYENFNLLWPSSCSLHSPVTAILGARSTFLTYFMIFQFLNPILLAVRRLRLIL